MSTIKSLLESAALKLKTISASPRLDAEILLSHLLQADKVRLIADSNKKIGADVERQFTGLLERRINHEPVAYLTGKKEFYGLEFAVNSNVLVPRPETELLVDIAVKISQNIDSDIKILDLGTGSGCIPVAIANELTKTKKKFSIDAVDVNKLSLQVAKQNITKHGYGKTITLINSDWFQSLPPEKKYNLIVSNPPYIAENDKDVSPETKYEPALALYSGSSGLDSIFTLINDCRSYLEDGGKFVFEIGSGQAERIKNYVNEIPLVFNIFQDLAGKDRVVMLSLS